MILQLRDYQEQGVREIEAGLAEYARIIAIAPTGAGKTVVAAAVIERAVRESKYCMFMAHRKELIDQTSSMLDVIKVEHGVMMGSHHRHRPDARVQVASIQTLLAKAYCLSCRNKDVLKPTCNVCHGSGKLPSRKRPPADLIIIDEAHRSLGKNYLSLIETYPKAQILAITATPWRLDGRGLGQLFKKMVVIANMRELIDAGFLLPLRLFGPPERIDTTGVRMSKGDYDDKSLEKVMRQSKLVGNIVEHYQRLGNNERAVCFATSILHSEDIVRRFKEAGVAAEHVDGMMGKVQREGILARLASGETKVVSNVDILCEGWDLPSLHCVILARPTKSITRYLQQVGRSMRPFEGQTYSLVLDHADCVNEHGLPQDFRDWTLEDREKKGKGPAQPQASISYCPTHGAYIGRECPKCNPGLFDHDLSESDDQLVEYTRELETIAMEASPVEPKSDEPPDHSVLKPRRAPRGSGEPEERKKVEFRAKTPCSKCGSTRTRRRTVETYKTKILCSDCGVTDWVVDKEAAKASTTDERRAEWHRLEAVRARHGFKAGWSAHKYREIFGMWPPPEFKAEQVPTRSSDWDDDAYDDDLPF
jgi:superfamily II DNA or RNA helicase